VCGTWSAEFDDDQLIPVYGFGTFTHPMYLPMHGCVADQGGVAGDARTGDHRCVLPWQKSAGNPPSLMTLATVCLRSMWMGPAAAFRRCWRATTPSRPTCSCLVPSAHHQGQGVPGGHDADTGDAVFQDPPALRR
jgi:hypothetical protein